MALRDRWERGKGRVAGMRTVGGSGIVLLGTLFRGNRCRLDMENLA